VGFIKLNRFGDPSGCSFDPAVIAEKARQAFPNTQILPGDQLALSAERAAANGAPEHVIRTLQRNQQEYGPAYSFEIGIDGGGTIQGRARRYDVTFLFPDTVGDVWRQRLLSFLQGLGSGQIEGAVGKFAEWARSNRPHDVTCLPDCSAAHASTVLFILSCSTIRSTCSSLGGFSVLQMPISCGSACCRSLETASGLLSTDAADAAMVTCSPSGSRTPSSSTTTPFSTRP
jgi:hypothetical protein